MTVGLPGVGLGGIFYLLGALLMPFRELIRVARGHPAEGRVALVMRQAAIAAAILAALWATGWLLGLLITALPDAATSAVRGTGRHAPAHSMLRTSALLLSLGTLAVVLTSVQAARVVVHATARRRRSKVPRLIPVRDLETDVRSSGERQRVDSGTFGRAR